MAVKSFRGIDAKHEHGASEVARDTRPLGERVAEVCSNPVYVIFIMVIGAVGFILEPLLTEILFICIIGIFIFAYTRKPTLPFKLPQVCGQLDYNDTIPGTSKPKKASGIFLFGNEYNTNKELWFSNDDMRTHALIFGSTGSGKTEALCSLVYNSLVQASGFIYIDGKGDNSLYSKIFSMVRSMGRDDDLLLINFMTGARDVIGAQKTRLSNTMNPFALGSSSMLSQLVVSLMGESGGDGDMWKGRAITFVESLMKLLCAMRDEGHLLIDANVIRNYFILEKLEQIVIDKRFPVTETNLIPLDSLNPILMEPLYNYLMNLPGYNKAKKGNQASEVREQHGFITMQLTRTFGSLADTYGHIVRANLAEMDLKDVVLNRRVLCVLLPALEKSPEELSNLGKIIVASLKSMMASGLGDEVEGTYQDVIMRKPTNSPAPYVCVMDEYGYYAVKGFAVVPAQARSLGFSAIFAGQDLPAFQKISKEEAASIVANTNVKVCMKLEDPTETWDLFNKLAGETYVTNVSGFQVNSGSMTNNYQDSKNASIDRRSRLDLLDLKDQREGDAHVFYRAQLVRARAFYANPKPAKRMQVNQFLCIDKPNDIKLKQLVMQLGRFKEVFSAPNFVMEGVDASEDIATMAKSFNNSPADLKPYERGISAVIAHLEKEVERQRQANAVADAERQEEFAGEVSAFSPIYAPPEMIMAIGEADLERFSSPLLLKSRTKQGIMHIERLCKESEASANKNADKVINDVTSATAYPPSTIKFEPDLSGVFECLRKLIREVGGESAVSDLDQMFKEHTEKED